MDKKFRFSSSKIWEIGVVHKTIRKKSENNYICSPLFTYELYRLRIKGAVVTSSQKYKNSITLEIYMIFTFGFCMFIRFRIVLHFKIKLRVISEPEFLYNILCGLNALILTQDLTFVRKKALSAIFLKKYYILYLSTFHFPSKDEKSVGERTSGKTFP